MKYSNRFFLYAPLGVFLALLAIAGVHWWVLATRLSAWLDAHNGREVMPSVTMHYDTRHITGFPFSLDTEFRDVTFTVETAHGPVQWRADKLAMHALTYGRDETIFEAAGPQKLNWTKDSGEKRTLPFAAGSLRASAIVKEGALARFDLDIVGFGSKAFTAQRLQFHMRRNGRGRIDLLVNADEMGIPPGDCPLLGAHVVQAEYSGSVARAEAFSPLLSGNGQWGEAVRNWRAAHGAVQGGGLWLKLADGSTALRLQDTLAQLPAEDTVSLPRLTGALCGY